jgi:hypothetical protein
VYFVDLTGQANNKPYGGLEQVITTTAGATYQLTFDLGASTYYNSSGLGAAALTASAAGASQLYTLSPSSTNQWAAETLVFTATGSTTTIEFLADSAYTSKYVGLDNVSVQPVQTSSVPEIDPASAASALTLLLGGVGDPARPACRAHGPRGKDASIRLTASISAGFTRCAPNPASRDRSRSCS